MDRSTHGTAAPCPIYEIAGRRFQIGAPGFAEAIDGAHSGHQRPRCMCRVEGVEMYVARYGDGYVVKRMPDTGSRHAPNCPSYEPPAELSGLGQLLGSAIIEDTTTGETTLQLGFPMTKMPGRSQVPPAGGDSDSVASGGTKLSLRGLLHYLWDQAELTRWHPGFAGKRSWATVRRHLLQAAEHKFARGDALCARLYVPEPFSVEERDAINTRRLAQWQHAVAAAGKAQHLMLLIGEVKEILPARYGFKAIVKHVPDQAFVIDEQLFRRLERRFEHELALWGNTDDIHMVLIATFAVSSSGVPTIHELSLMPATRQWLPVENGFEKLLLDRLVGENRSFVKSLQYSLARDCRIATAMLLDCEVVPWPLVLHSLDVAGADTALTRGLPGEAFWIWRPAVEPMPDLPKLHRNTEVRRPTTAADVR